MNMNILLLVLCLVRYSSQLSFNFTSFQSNNTAISYERAYTMDGQIILTKGTAISYERAYTIDGQFILTKGTANIARATYSQPLPLYSDTILTDFQTNFSFIINSNNRSHYGDGLAFFLAPEGSRIPDGASKGGGLGLTKDDQWMNTSANKFVAVEFDICSNFYDPVGDHVGIDVDSLKSSANVTWKSRVMEGKINEAWIRYDSVSKNLSVVFTGFEGNDSTVIYQGLYYTIDLRKYLPKLVTFGFSAASGNSSAAQSILSWSFSSTLQDDATTKKTNVGLVIGSIIGGTILFCGLGLILFIWWRKRGYGDGYMDINLGEDDFERGTGPRRFTYRELSRMTSNFAVENKLGEGGFGAVYKGFSRELNGNIAVKRVSSKSRQGIKEFASEVRIISRLRHRNLVQLLGWCREKKGLLLVYEYMENGSLDYHLFAEESRLTWPVRYQIAQGLASALLYLHQEWEQCVVHRDIKSSNVMLDSNFNTKLGDFGLARLVDHEKGSQTTILAGTMGYMAPECVVKGRASRESDVYSFGVVALEIACGRKPLNHGAQENEISLVEWVWELYGMDKLFEAVDLKLCGEFDKGEMERLMMIGLWCAHPHNRARPSIRQVVQVLNCEAALPVLPSERPLVNYRSASMISTREQSSLSNGYNTELSKQTSSSATDSSKQTSSSAIDSSKQT